MGDTQRKSLEPVCALELNGCGHTSSASKAQEHGNDNDYSDIDDYLLNANDADLEIAFEHVNENINKDDDNNIVADKIHKKMQFH